jgi:hypothetical protein
MGEDEGLYNVKNSLSNPIYKIFNPIETNDRENENKPKDRK